MNKKVIKESDGVIDLVGIDTFPNVELEIYLHGTNKLIGNIWFDKDIDSEFVKYYGNVGYYIKEEYRGNNYSLNALKILKSIIKKKGIPKMLFSVDESNIVSRKVLDKFKARLLCYRPVPKNHKIYNFESSNLLIYQYNLLEEKDEKDKSKKYL